jgi:hypothetical protein
MPDIRPDCPFHNNNTYHTRSRTVALLPSPPPTFLGDSFVVLHLTIGNLHSSACFVALCLSLPVCCTPLAPPFIPPRVSTTPRLVSRELVKSLPTTPLSHHRREPAHTPARHDRVVRAIGKRGGSIREGHTVGNWSLSLHSCCLLRARSDLPPNCSLGSCGCAPCSASANSRPRCCSFAHRFTSRPDCRTRAQVKCA